LAGEQANFPQIIHDRIVIKEHGRDAMGCLQAANPTVSQHGRKECQTTFDSYQDQYKQLVAPDAVLSHLKDGTLELLNSRQHNILSLLASAPNRIDQWAGR